MRALARLWWRFRAIGRRDALEEGLDEEIRFHIEQQTEKNLRAGMPPDEARQARPERGRSGLSSRMRHDDDRRSAGIHVRAAAAPAAFLVRMVLHRVLVLATYGVAAGVAGAFAFSHGAADPVA